MKTHRYFALIISIPIDQAGLLGGITEASTLLGNMVREAGPSFLPAGSRITRSIEIAEEVAINGIR
jgi:hypothetical protein